MTSEMINKPLSDGEHKSDETGALVITDRDSSDWKMAERVEAQVFIDADYVDSQDELAEEYAKYAPKSEFILIKKDGVPAGSTRIIMYDEAIGFKTIDDVYTGRLEITDEGEKLLAQIPFEKTFEVGTIAVPEEFRDTPDNEDRVASQLYGMIFSEADKKGIDYALASFDDNYFHRFSSLFGDGCFQLGEAVDYMGSKTVPVLLDKQKMRAYMDETMPGAYDFIVQSADAMRL